MVEEVSDTALRLGLLVKCARGKSKDSSTS